MPIPTAADAVTQDRSQTPNRAIVGRPRRIGPQQGRTRSDQQQHPADGLLPQDFGEPLRLRPRATREESQIGGHWPKPTDWPERQIGFARLCRLRHLYGWSAGKSGRQSQPPVTTQDDGRGSSPVAMQRESGGVGRRQDPVRISPDAHDGDVPLRSASRTDRRGVFPLSGWTPMRSKRCACWPPVGSLDSW